MNKKIDEFSLLHFIQFFILGLIIKNNYKLAFILSILWEIFEYFVEGTSETYGTVKKWAINTASDLFVEIGAAWWMVL